ncbi:MAG TPA: glycosyltransferase [Bauldia sp.]|nr:glycosyltransferase [Bauldia sp.]
MITAIIETCDDEVGLAHTLAALVPAAAEGLVRDVVVIDYGSSDGTLKVADVAGCTIMEATAIDGDALRLAAAGARGDWLLLLSPAAVLQRGWQGPAMAFIDRALVAGRARSSLAVVRRGAVVAGWRARLMSMLSLTEGRLVSKAAYLAASPSSLPSSAASLASGARRGAA